MDEKFFHLSSSYEGLLNISCPRPINAPERPINISERECSKNPILSEGFVQSCPEQSRREGRSPFGARSVLSVREHGKRATSVCASRFGKARERR